MAGNGSALFRTNPFAGIKVPGQEQAPKKGGKNGKEDRKPTKYWLNVGLQRQDKFLTLPMGIPLDDLEPKPIPGPQSKNQDFRNLRIGEAQLHGKIQEIMAGLKPGQSIKLPLEVEIRMVDEKMEPTEKEVENNPYAVGDLLNSNEEDEGE